MPNVLTVVGNRPQFIKAAAVSTHLRERVEEILVHTGQHYDPELSDIFFEQLEMPEPDRELEVGSGTHAEQTVQRLTGAQIIAEYAESADEAVAVHRQVIESLFFEGETL